MTNTTRLVATACLMLAAGATRADSQLDFSANTLVPACKNFSAQAHSPDEDIFQQGVCVGEVTGVWDIALALRVVCPPRGVSRGQAVRVVTQFIDARPARMHEALTTLALDALIAAWPCKK